MKIISYNPREKEELERGIQEMKEKVGSFILGFWGSRILEDDSRHWRTREREREIAGFQGKISLFSVCVCDCAWVGILDRDFGVCGKVGKSARNRKKRASDRLLPVSFP